MNLRLVLHKNVKITNNKVLLTVFSSREFLLSFHNQYLYYLIVDVHRLHNYNCLFMNQEITL